MQDDHASKAADLVERALHDSTNPAHMLAAAGIFAVLHVAETIKMSLRDIVYELRD